MEEEVNRKGRSCRYRVIPCQEGFCSECQIYLDWSECEGEFASALANLFVLGLIEFNEDGTAARLTRKASLRTGDMEDSVK